MDAFWFYCGTVGVPWYVLTWKLIDKLNQN